MLNKTSTPNDVLTERDMKHFRMKQLESLVWGGSGQKNKLELCNLWMELEGMTKNEALTRLHTTMRDNNRARNLKYNKKPQS